MSRPFSDQAPDRAPDQAQRRRHLWHLGVTVALFLFSRAVLMAGGVRFRAEPTSLLKLLDLTELSRDPFLAFTHNHIQPPLWNFFVGAVLRWSPFGPGISFQVLFLLFGLATIVLLWFILREFGAPHWVATTASTLVGWNPLMIRNESILNIETIVTLLVTLAAWTFIRYVRTRSLVDFGIFVGVVVVGALTRTTLHPVWVIGAVVIALLAARPRAARRATAGVIAAAAVVLALPMVHNARVYGSTGFSSYSSMNLQRIAILQLSEKDLDALIADGTLSEAARILPFSDYTRYEPVFGPCRPHTGVPVLDEPREGNGETNFNSLCFLKVDEQARHDAVAAIEARPGVYAKSVGRATLLFSSWRYRYLLPDTGAMRVWTEAYTPLMLPRHLHYDLGEGGPQSAVAVLGPRLGGDPFSFTIAGALLLALAYGARSLWRVIRHRPGRDDWGRLFIAFTVVSMASVSILAEFFENGRYREPLDPLILGPLYAAVLTLSTTWGRRLVIWARTRVWNNTSTDRGGRHDR